MVNKTILYLFSFIILLMSACVVNKSAKLETPFVTVVKLVSAENTLHFQEATEYIDVIQVYSKLGSKQPEEDWKNLCRFQNNLGKDKKFSNDFEYYNYDIEETVARNKASVSFKSKDTNAIIKTITYGLQKRQQKWVVVSIDYLK